jgi:hypothetical protein
VSFHLYLPGSIADLLLPTSFPGDYSAAYIIFHTEDENLEGAGMTFTIGRGNEIVRPLAGLLGVAVADAVVLLFVHRSATPSSSLPSGSRARRSRRYLRTWARPGTTLSLTLSSDGLDLKK